MNALLDGAPADHVTLDERMLHYGDGVFRTLLIDGSVVVDLDGQIDHLLSDARRLGLPAPDPARLAAEARALAQGQGGGVLKLMLGRGGGGRGYRPAPDASARRLLIRYPLPAHPRSAWSEGIAVRDCALRLGRQAVLAGIKHLNRLEQVLARQEWDDPGIAEGILCDSEGLLVGGTMSNLFWLRGKTLHTPRLDHAGVSGRMRARILAAAPGLGLAVRECHATAAAARAEAEAVVLSNSLIGCWPVVRWAGRELDSRALARQLLDALAHPWRGRQTAS